MPWDSVVDKVLAIERLRIAETAKANNLKPYEYFKYLLEELPKHEEFEEPSYLDELLPWSEKLPGCCQKKLKSES